MIRIGSNTIGVSRGASGLVYAPSEKVDKLNVSKLSTMLLVSSKGLCQKNFMAISIVVLSLYHLH